MEGTKLPGEKRSSENELKEQGWKKQSTIGEPRLSECVKLYRTLGYEVHLEPVMPDELDSECRKCYELEGEVGAVKTIYIRPLRKR